MQCSDLQTCEQISFLSLINGLPTGTTYITFMYIKHTTHNMHISISNSKFQCLIFKSIFSLRSFCFGFNFVVNFASGDERNSCKRCNFKTIITTILGRWFVRKSKKKKPNHQTNEEWKERWTRNAPCYPKSFDIQCNLNLMNVLIFTKFIASIWGLRVFTHESPPPSNNDNKRKHLWERVTFRIKCI